MNRVLRRCLLLGLLAAPSAAWAQEVVDRLAARIEGDIILLSDVKALARYQLFLDGKSESDAQLLNRLIDQWVVRSEAGVARFPQPSDEEIERSLARLKRSFSTPEEFEARKKLSGVTDEEIQRMLKSQLYLSNYLDSRFRPTIQIADKDVEEFYKDRVIPRAESRGQTPPTLDAAREFIQEALVQGAINDQAERWMKESRSRLRVQSLLDESGK